MNRAIAQSIEHFAHASTQAGSVIRSLEYDNDPSKVVRSMFSCDPISYKASLTS